MVNASNPGLLGGGLGNRPSVPTPQKPDKPGQEFNMDKQVSTQPDQLQTATPLSAPATEQTSETTEIKKQQRGPETRKASLPDLIAHLVQKGIPNTDTNRTMAMFMTQHGVELSEENFQALLKLLKGRGDKNAIESSVVTLSKGLGDSTKAADFLRNFLAQASGKQASSQKLETSLKSFKDAISTGKFFNPGITGSLSSIIDEIDKEIKKLTKKTGDGLKLEKFKRGELTKDIYSFHQLLAGLEKQQGKEIPPELKQNISDLKRSLHEYLGELSSQSILSKSSEKQPIGITDNYAYWQIPNLMAEDPHKSAIDILIKKDPMKKTNAIDEQKTSLLVKFDTPKLGEVAIEAKVMNQKIWYTFNTEEEETGKMIRSFERELIDKMEAVGFETMAIQTKRKKVDVKKLILPVQSLDSMVRINAEA